MTPEILALVTSIVTLIVLMYFLIKGKQPVTVETVNNALAAAQPLAVQLVEFGKAGAAAAEMLANTGKLPRDEKFNYALDYVLGLLPANHGFTREQVVGAIEAGAYLADTMGKAIENGKRNTERP
jgi:hypothetical protein